MAARQPAVERGRPLRHLHQLHDVVDDQLADIERRPRVSSARTSRSSSDVAINGGLGPPDHRDEGFQRAQCAEALLQRADIRREDVIVFPREGGYAATDVAASDLSTPLLQRRHLHRAALRRSTMAPRRRADSDAAGQIPCRASALASSGRRQATGRQRLAELLRIARARRSHWSRRAGPSPSAAPVWAGERLMSRAVSSSACRISA